LAFSDTSKDRSAFKDRSSLLGDQRRARTLVSNSPGFSSEHGRLTVKEHSLRDQNQDPDIHVFMYVRIS
jgi:hypothetical protein